MLNILVLFYEISGFLCFILIILLHILLFKYGVSKKSTVKAQYILILIYLSSYGIHTLCSLFLNTFSIISIISILFWGFNAKMLFLILQQFNAEFTDSVFHDIKDVIDAKWKQVEMKDDE